MLLSEKIESKFLDIVKNKPLHEDQWPAWPRAGMYAQRTILEILHSQKWTISGISQKKDSYEKIFAKEFSSYIGRKYGVPCSSGTAALTIALQTINIKPYDEVIIAGLTWVACASSILNLGAIPILTDISSSKLTSDPNEIRKAVTSKTKAIIAIHMYSSKAYICEILKICKEYKLHFIEDASQAHGGTINNKKIGSFGDFSIFSFQQSKLLTGGEGGIVLINNKKYYKKLQQLRADGRMYSSNTLGGGYYHLKNMGQYMGRNLCMSEFNAGILIEGLSRLDRENEHRQIMINNLKNKILKVKGMEILCENSHNGDVDTFYKVPIKLSFKGIEELGINWVCIFLSTILRLPILALDNPLNKNKLYNPLSNTFVKNDKKLKDATNLKRFKLINAEKLSKNTILFPHYAFLGGEEEIDSIFNSLKVLSENIDELIEFKQKQELY